MLTSEKKVDGRALGIYRVKIVKKKVGLIHCPI